MGQTVSSPVGTTPRSPPGTAEAGTEPVVISVETGPLVDAPSSGSWWDVPLSATSTPGSTRQARATDEEHKARQRLFLSPPSQS